jgi:flagellar assembly protein FliH
MRAPPKYLFDADFAAVSAGKPSIALAEHAKMLEQAEAAGYARGFAAAEAAAKADAERRAAAALERIAGAIEGHARTLAAVEARLETEAVEVAVAVAKKLAPELLAREPFAEIAALAADCFRHLVATPHVVVRVNDALQTTARERLDEIVRSRGLESRLVVLAEPDIALGDCRIEWADGGITRNAAATAAAIDEAVSRYIKARLGAAPMPDVNWRIKE